MQIGERNTEAMYVCTAPDLPRYHGVAGQYIRRLDLSVPNHPKHVPTPSGVVLVGIWADGSFHNHDIHDWRAVWTLSTVASAPVLGTRSSAVP